MHGYLSSVMIFGNCFMDCFTSYIHAVDSLVFFFVLFVFFVDELLFLGLLKQHRRADDHCTD